MANAAALRIPRSWGRKRPNFKQIILEVAANLMYKFNVVVRAPRPTLGLFALRGRRQMRRSIAS